MTLDRKAACSECHGGAATTPDFKKPDGTVTFRVCKCGLLHGRHYDGYWWTMPNGYNNYERLEQWREQKPKS